MTLFTIMKLMSPTTSRLGGTTEATHDRWATRRKRKKKKIFQSIENQHTI